MSEDKKPIDTPKDSPEELTPDAITTNPEKTLKELKSLRAENAKKNDLIKGLEEKYNGINGKLSKIEEAAKAEKDKKLLADGKIQELLDSTTVDNTTLKSELDAIKEENETFKTAEKARAEQLTADKQLIIDSIKEANPEQASNLTTDLTIQLLNQIKELATGHKIKNVGAYRPNNGTGTEGIKPDYSGLSTHKQLLAQIQDLSK